MEDMKRLLVRVVGAHKPQPFGHVGVYSDQPIEPKCPIAIGDKTVYGQPGRRLIEFNYYPDPGVAKMLPTLGTIRVWGEIILGAEVVGRGEVVLNNSPHGVHWGYILVYLLEQDLEEYLCN